MVEAFIGDDLQKITRYTEFEVAPSNERLDVKLDSPEKDFAWDSRFESAIKIDEPRHVWTAEVRIPLQKLSATKPSAGTRWRLNLYRCDRAHKAFLAWNPTLQNSFHAPERFGFLVFDASPPQ